MDIKQFWPFIARNYLIAIAMVIVYIISSNLTNIIIDYGKTLSLMDISNINFIILFIGANIALFGYLLVFTNLSLKWISNFQLILIGFIVLVVSAIIQIFIDIKITPEYANNVFTYNAILGFILYPIAIAYIQYKKDPTKEG